MKDQTTASKYREFPLEEGFMLYVGKSAANNDELTMKFAKQNDIWLHARGVSGSHAVIRVTGKNPQNALSSKLLKLLPITPMRGMQSYARRLHSQKIRAQTERRESRRCGHGT